MNKLEVINIKKNYKNVVALDDISITLESGKIYGILGNNGAGKTTLINMITNRVFPTSGSILVDGESVIENEKVQSKIFCVTAKSWYPGDLKIKDLYKWESKFYPNFDMELAMKISESFDLDTNQRIGKLSTGYNTIVKTIVTIASNAEIMLLDEPVLGIDSLYREIFYDVVSEYHNKHKNLIIITTHLIDEVERILEHIIILSKGIVLRNCPIKEIVTGSKRLNEEYVSILKEARNAKL